MFGGPRWAAGAIVSRDLYVHIVAAFYASRAPTFRLLLNVAVFGALCENEFLARIAQLAENRLHTLEQHAQTATAGEPHRQTYLAGAEP